MNYFGTIVVSILIVASQAQIPRFGPCPDVKAKQHLDMFKFSGKWYEYEKYFTFSEITGKCTTYTYKNDSETTMLLTFKQYEINNNLQTTIDGIVAYINNSNVAEMDVTYPAHDFGAPAPHWIMDTDYKKYAIIYGCANFFQLVHIVNIWILTREPRNQDMTKPHKILQQYNLDPSLLIRTDQFFCPRNN